MYWLENERVDEKREINEKLRDMGKSLGNTWFLPKWK